MDVPLSVVEEHVDAKQQRDVFLSMVLYHAEVTPTLRAAASASDELPPPAQVTTPSSVAGVVSHVTRSKDYVQALFYRWVVRAIARGAREYDVVFSKVCARACLHCAFAIERAANHTRRRRISSNSAHVCTSAATLS